MKQFLFAVLIAIAVILSCALIPGAATIFLLLIGLMILILASPIIYLLALNPIVWIICVAFCPPLLIVCLICVIIELIKN